nr:hypothetical protein Iba_chr09cCG5550 [Ipomoea batatas]
MNSVGDEQRSDISGGVRIHQLGYTKAQEERHFRGVITLEVKKFTNSFMFSNLTLVKLEIPLDWANNCSKNAQNILVEFSLKHWSEVQILSANAQSRRKKEKFSKNLPLVYTKMKYCLVPVIKEKQHGQLEALASESNKKE